MQQLLLSRTQHILDSKIFAPAPLNHWEELVLGQNTELFKAPVPWAIVCTLSEAWGLKESCVQTCISNKVCSGQNHATLFQGVMQQSLQRRPTGETWGAHIQTARCMALLQHASSAKKPGYIGYISSFFCTQYLGLKPVVCLTKMLRASPWRYPNHFWRR